MYYRAYTLSYPETKLQTSNLSPPFSFNLSLSLSLYLSTFSLVRSRRESHPKPTTMEDLWKRAKTFAEEAAKKSQALATSSTSSARIADLVSETAKKSKELAAEASKRAEEIKSAIAAEAAKHADSIKSLSDGISIPPQISAAIASASAAAAAPSSSSSPLPPDDADLEKFGVTDDLRSFVRGLTSTTFQNFPLSSGTFL